MPESCHEEIRKLKENICSLTRELCESKERLLCMQAEFENHEKRLSREKAEFEKRACEGLVAGLLPAIDNLEIASENAKEEEDKKGIRMILDGLLSFLSSRGLKRIEAGGKMIDPMLHDAVMAEKSELSPGTVTAEIQKGYIFNGRVIRHTKVKVAK